MNQVSWLIYFAEVADHLGPFLVVVGVICFTIGGILMAIAYNFLTHMTRWSEKLEIDNAIKMFKHQRVGGITMVVLAFVLWTGSVFVPSQNTVLAIAASQFGEQLLHTKTANLAEQALNAWLQKQITTVTDKK